MRAGVGTFRIGAFRQKGSPAVVVRYIPSTIPPLDTLGVPEVLKDVIMQKRGLILMVGATGCGKSTSLPPCWTTVTSAGPATS